ncbi:SGF29 tudor-like domain-containing protein [Hyaloraphidium curvatum]|nr:SGF29 tudor-like domain-containing protein [Hyaloraphidium curvatum]
MSRKSRTDDDDVWQSVCQKLADVHAARITSHDVVENANRVHQKIVQMQGRTQPSGLVGAAQDLFRLYSDAHSKLAHELRAIDSVIEHLDIFRAMRTADEANLDQIRRKKRRLDEGTPSPAPSPGPTITPFGYPEIVPVGSEVAVQPVDQPWMLATVQSYRPEKGKYEVEDIDVDEETGTKRRYVFPAKAVHPILPNRPEMTQGSFVLALYPGTTCFYQATILGAPSQNRSTYMVLFDDDNNETRLVERKYVLPIPTRPVKLKK